MNFLVDFVTRTLLVADASTVAFRSAKVHITLPSGGSDAVAAGEGKKGIICDDIPR